MDRAIELLELTVVGRDQGHCLGSHFLSEWVRDNWESRLSYDSEVCVMEKGWFAFILKSKGDVD